MFNMDSSCDNSEIVSLQQELLTLFGILKIHNRVCYVVSEFLKIQKKYGGHVVYAEFEKLLYCLLMARKNCSEAQNILKLIPSIVIGAHKAEMAEMMPSPFCSRFFEFVFKTAAVRNSLIRYRCLQLISTALHEMAELSIELGNLGNDFFDRLTRLLLFRSKDRDRKVRSIVAVALGRIQQPDDPECPAMAAVLFLLRYDPCSEVRLNALKAIKVNHRTLPELLERCRDYSALVRREAYKRLVEIVHPRYLTISQRCSLLQQGLTDRSLPLRTFCETVLLDKWLDAFGGNIVDLLNRLEVISRTNVCEHVLIAYFKNHTVEDLIGDCDILDHKNLPKVLTCEHVLYWRVLVEYVKKTGEQNLNAADTEAIVSQLLPSVIDMSSMFESYVVDTHMKNDKEDERISSEFIVAQLIDLIFLMDLSEVASRLSICIPFMVVECIFSCRRERLKCTIELLLTSCGADSYLINKLVGMHFQLTKSFDETSDFCLNEIMKRFPSSEEHDSQNAMEAAYYDFAKTMDAALAEKLLCMLCELFSLTIDVTLTPLMKQMLKILVYPLLEHSEQSARYHAMRTLAVYALESEEYLQIHWRVLQSAVQYDGSYLANLALKGIFDLAFKYGFESFIDAEECPETNNVDKLSENPDDVDDPLPRHPLTKQHLLFVLKTMFDGPDEEVHIMIAEGVCKLMLHDRLHNAELLTMLVSRLFSPSSENNPPLRQCISSFLPAYAFNDSRHQEAIVEVFIPVIRSLCNEEQFGEMSSIGLDQTIDFLVKLTCCVFLEDSAPGKQVRI
ncbi:HEAT repeat protein, partial [Trichuris suis]